MSYETTTAKRAEDDKLLTREQHGSRGYGSYLDSVKAQRERANQNTTVVDAARRFLTVDAPAEETPAARKQSAATYKVERIDLDDLQLAANTDHMQKITDYLGECDSRRERTSRVIAAGGVKGALEAMLEELTTLRESPIYCTSEVEAATATLIEQVRDLIVYDQQLNLKPLHYSLRAAW